MNRPADTEVCKFHEFAPGQFVGINEGQGLYVIPVAGGYTSLGFDNAERRRAAVMEWLGIPVSPFKPGTPEAYNAYRGAMDAGARHNAATGARCNADLTPEFIGLEGKRVEVTTPDGDKFRFYVGKSTGWMPIHLEIKTRRSSGGGSVYFPKGSTFRVVS